MPLRQRGKGADEILCSPVSIRASCAGCKLQGRNLAMVCVRTVVRFKVQNAVGSSREERTFIRREDSLLLVRQHGKIPKIERGCAGHKPRQVPVDDKAIISMADARKR